MSHYPIFKPVLSEKSLNDQKNGKYHFWVQPNIGKHQIAVAFQQVFSVKPLAVTTHIVKGKSKTNWQKKQTFRKKDQKRAIITVPKGEKIKILAQK